MGRKAGPSRDWEHEPVEGFGFTQGWCVEMIRGMEGLARRCGRGYSGFPQLNRNTKIHRFGTTEKIECVSLSVRA